ncbi:MAG TPA: hypothetical protein VIS96_10930 [Terrimicrobiaceae bacterium]
MKIAIKQKRPGRDGRRLVAFYDDRWLVPDRSVTELSGRPGYRVPAVVCFERNGQLSKWKAKLCNFDPNSYEKTTIPLENYLHPWIEAGIRLAASDFKMRPKRGYECVIELSLGKEKPLYHLVWERWPIWQSEAHREKMMKLYSLSAGAHEDLVTAFPGKLTKRVTPEQVKDACKRLGLPLKLSR